MVRLTALLSVGLAALATSAADISGVQLNQKVVVGGKELVLNGAGLRTRLLFKVYVGSLYVPARARDFASVIAQSPRRVQLNLLRDPSSHQITGALGDGLKEGNDQASLAAIGTQRDQFIAIITSCGDVKEGAVVTFDFVDGETRIGLNGVTQGTVSGEAFNRALTAVWIGDAIRDDLKSDLLGEPER